MLRVDALEVRYDDFTLGPLSFSLEDGAHVALVGPNGAGKSTTLRALCGLLPEARGEVLLDGVDIRTLGPEVRTRVGVLSERHLGFGWTTVSEHLRFLEAFHPGWDAQYAKGLLLRLGVPEDKKLANLSKGTHVKLALVAAEAFRPPVLLLDEPTSGIDPLMRGELLNLLGEIAPPGGSRTVVFSSHILEDVEEVADRVLLIRDGTLLDDVRVEELRRTDASGSVSKAIYRRLTHA